MDAITALHIIARLLAVLAILQSTEFLILSRATRNVWRWADLETELVGDSVALRAIFRFFLGDKNFFYLNAFRILVAVSVLIAPTLAGVVILFALHVLTLLRWLGTFNGGSDYMNLLLLLVASVAFASPPSLAIPCLWYISFQTCLSYFRAGWYKIKNPRWRSGFALREFVHSPIYQQRTVLAVPLRHEIVGKGIAWSIMLFEITFPLALFHHQLALGYMAAGIGFHLLNAYTFGLNRFVFAWLAAYPALYFFSLS